MNTMYAASRRADGIIDRVFGSLTEAVIWCSINDLDNNVYRIEEILEDNGCEVECKAIYDIAGNKEA